MKTNSKQDKDRWVGPKAGRYKWAGPIDAGRLVGAMGLSCINMPTTMGPMRKSFQCRLVALKGKYQVEEDVDGSSKDGHEEVQSIGGFAHDRLEW